MSRIHWIPVEGESHIEETGVPPTLEVMQKYVEGYIQLMPVSYNEKQCQMIFNEEGRLRQMPPNSNASKIFGSSIVGPAILLEGLKLD